MAKEMFWIFVWKNSKNILRWMELSAILSTIYVILFILLFIT